MKLTHHAYLLEGSQTLLPALVLDASTELGLAHNSPDLWVRSFEVFGIAQSREMTARATMQGSGAHQLFIIAATSITTEAQQALLKLLEEPMLGTIFILLVPPGSVLPTIRSRTMAYPNSLQTKDAKGGLSSVGLAEEESAELAKTFLQSSNKERSAIIATLLKDEEGTREKVRAFVNALEVLLYKDIARAQSREALSEISLIRTYLSDRSASYKMLLEHLAVVI